ncbi:MAG: hypothetical protein AB7F98_14855 [Novosphingobium sp.]
MRMKLLAGLALIAAASALAQSAERLVSPPLAGFTVGYERANAQQSIREEVPRGETVDRWTRMVTTQWFSGLAARTTPAQYAQNILGALPRQCPGAKASPVANVTVSGRPAVRFQVDCPTGGGETFILLAISGTRDMHVKQVAWRGPTTPAGLQWGRGFLAATVLCRAGRREAVCHRSN